jgi:hypothetical protein
MRNRRYGASYENLAEMAAIDPEAWEQLQRFRRIKEEGGVPEITWRRRFTVTEKYPLPRIKK